MSVPQRGAVENAPSALSADSAGGLWVAGKFQASPTSPENAVLEHWSGGRWKVISVPVTSNEFSELVDVKALSPTNVWVLGIQGPAATPLLARWNGRSWTDVFCALSPYTTTYSALGAASSTDVWFASTIYTNPARLGMWHWNGSRCRLHQETAAGTAVDSAADLTMLSPSNVWMVGNRHTGQGTEQGLGYNWNGSRYALVPAQPAGRYSTFNAVAPAGGSGLWAVGFRATQTSDFPLIERLTGSTWRIARARAFSAPGDLQDVAAGRGNTVWAAGSVLNRFGVTQAVTFRE
jgi:hypothetical protein